MYFHSVSLPVVRHLGPPLSWPTQNSSDVRTYRLDVTEFAKDISTFLTGVAVFKTAALTVSGVIWDQYSVTMQVTGGLPSYKETISFQLTFNNGDTENVNVFVPVSAQPAAIPNGSILVDGQVVTFANKPVEIRNMPPMPNGPADQDLIVLYRAPDFIGVSPVGTLALGASTQTTRLTTSGNVNGHRALMFDRMGFVIHADPTVSSFNFAGISLQAAMSGDSVSVCFGGLVIEPSWSWIPDEVVFIGNDGLLTQAPPTTGILQQIGVSINGTSILVQPYAPVILV